jgi:hypothetical protein
MMTMVMRRMMNTEKNVEGSTGASWVAARAEPRMLTNSAASLSEAILQLRFGYVQLSRAAFSILTKMPAMKQLNMIMMR